MQRTVVLNVVGLTSKLIGGFTPRLKAWVDRANRAIVTPVLPAVTCTAQATYLTGKLPQEHGIVANGWYFRDECEVKFWRQSNHLVQAPKLWEMARSHDPNFTCANLFWWYNMYSTVDYAVTPRPMYPADGRKLPDIYTQPQDLRSRLQTELGPFPLFRFWGPATDITATQWIANAAKRVDIMYQPTLCLVYLPHLDYCCQKVGVNPSEISQDLRELDQVVGDLIDYYELQNIQVIILSEYGITPVSCPIHLNRILREYGLLTVREELGRELLDAGASDAFAVADHQVAHIYVKNPHDRSRIAAILSSTPGVAQVLDAETKVYDGLDHPRSGELIAIAKSDAWFTYYYWLDDQKAPDFARTVDIHRKPGYDPAELFLDPTIRFPSLKIGTTLLKKALGLRTLMDVIPLDATVVKGSHGCIPDRPENFPVFITQSPHLDRDLIHATEVCQLILQHCLDPIAPAPLPIDLTDPTNQTLPLNFQVEGARSVHPVGHPALGDNP